ncbi:MAG: PEP-CTERM sorting domain-containing protein [Betaproteobacteria bacterium]|nr:PEP-CTERM sorting domain-containing protein [Betaproteobacteria bacterium]
MKTLKQHLFGLALTAILAPGLASAATVSIVGSRSELSTISSAFNSYGDTVTQYGDWSTLSSSQLNSIFSSDIVWEGDIFNPLSSDVQSRMIGYVQGNGGLFLTAERPCCDLHNDSLQVVGRTLTGDNGLLIGNLGTDIFGHAFSTSPTTILTSPNDIRGQDAQHNGPGRVEPTGGITSNACFIISGGTTCTAAAWGPDALVDPVGRLVIYGDINSQPSLVTNYNGDQFENIRQFLLAGFTGGNDVCVNNPNLPGCTGGNNVPEPGTLALTVMGLIGLARRLTKRQQI